MSSIAFISVLAAIAPALRAQSPNPPDTYSFSAISSLIGPNMTIKVNRNRSRELIERATIARPGETGRFHDRVLYDFQAHRLFTLDLNSNICTTQEYSSPYAPSPIDPIGAAAETAAIARLPANLWIRDTVNGIPVRMATLPLSEGQGQYRYWLDEKYNFVVKVALALGAEPMSTRFEIRQLSFAPSPDSLFLPPRQCRQIGGVSSANGGHAEMTAEVNVPSETHQLGQEWGHEGAASPPRTALIGKVTKVQLHLVPESYTGRCPSQIQLVADITTNGPGTVWYRFLAGAVSKNGQPEGTVTFPDAGTKTVVLDGTIRSTPAVPNTSIIAAMEDAQGQHGPQTVGSGPVSYNRTCQ